MNNWEKKYRERVIEQNLLREPKDFEEQADIAEDKWIILTELLEEQQDTINELKNTIERQEILIEKLKCCGNCNKCMYLEGYGYKCKEEEVSLFDIREIPDWCESWEPKED